MIKLTFAAIAAVVLAVAGVAYASGHHTVGLGLGDKAWAQVSPNGGSPVFVKSKGFVSVSSPATGVYCLRPAPGVSLTPSAPVATQELSGSSSLGIVTLRGTGIPNPLCPVSDLQVTTWNSASNPANPTAVNTVAFDVLVP